MLRALAVVNAANAANAAQTNGKKASLSKATSVGGGSVRNAVGKAQRANEEARKTLQRI